MKQQIEIKIKGVQVIDGDEESQEVEAHGETYVKDGVRYILYREMAGDKRNEVRTLIKDDGRRIEVKKSGAIGVRMCFADEMSYNSHYETPMGAVNLRTVTKGISRQDEGDGLMREINYSVYMDDQYIGENLLGIYAKFIV